MADEPQAGISDLLNIITTRNALPPCTCQHTLKKHKRSGRCRKGCTCDYALRKDERKRRRNEHV